MSVAIGRSKLVLPDGFELHIAPDDMAHTQVITMSVADKYGKGILRAQSRVAKTLVMDNPLTTLTVCENLVKEVQSEITKREVERKQMATNIYSAHNTIDCGTIASLDTIPVQITTASSSTSCTVTIGTEESHMDDAKIYWAPCAVTMSYALDTQTVQDITANIRVGAHTTYGIHVPSLTAEQKLEQEWNILLDQKRQEQYILTRSVAEKRSLELLTRNLTAEQLKRFEEDKCIPIDTGGGNKYLIKPARSINIEVIGRGHKLCAGPVGDMPIYDFMLAQKLFLEQNEKRFLRIAIEHR